MNIYLVQSPLQVLSAFEARARFGSADDIIFVMFSPNKKKNNQQLEMTLRATGWTRTYKFKPKTRIPLYNLILKLRLYSYIRQLARRGIERIFMGDFRSIWMNRARAISGAAETWLLDDGAVTPFVQKNYFNEGIFWPPHKKNKSQKHLRAISNYFFRADQVARTPIHLFSAFHVIPPETPGQRVLQHGYEHLRGLVNQKQRANRQVFFFGSKLSEAELISHKLEVDSLINIAAWYQQQGASLVYIPHREDKARKLESLALAGIEVRNLGLPAELYFALATEVPAHIATFCSSAINNLSVMYEFDSMRAFVLPQSGIRPSSRKAFELLYSGFESMRIGLVSLDEKGSIGEAVPIGESA